MKKWYNISKFFKKIIKKTGYQGHMRVEDKYYTWAEEISIQNWMTLVRIIFSFKSKKLNE